MNEVKGMSGRKMALLASIHGLAGMSLYSVKIPKRRIGTAARYAPCPCGSGKKWKFCCGNKEQTS